MIKYILSILFGSRCKKMNKWKIQENFLKLIFLHGSRFFKAKELQYLIKNIY